MVEGRMMQDVSPRVNELGKEMLNFMDTMPQSMIDNAPEAYEYIRANWKDFDEYSSMKSFLDELVERMEARQSFLEEQLDIFQGKPY